jgi:DNA-binding LytR/AlgR family response regulator
MEENETPKTYGPIPLPGTEKKVIEDPGSIRYIMVDDYLIWIYFEKGDPWYIVMSLTAILEQLNPDIFFQPHRKYILNGKFVISKQRNKRGYDAIMSDEVKIPVAVLKVEAFLKFIDPFLSER